MEKQSLEANMIQEELRNKVLILQEQICQHQSMLEKAQDEQNSLC